LLFLFTLALDLKQIQMKKYFILLAILCVGATSVNAQQKQGLKLEGTLSLPVGDLSDGLVFGLGADFTYLFNIADSFQIGAATGFHNVFARSSNTGPVALSGAKKQDFSYVPLVASSRYYLFDEFFVGADLGYSFVLIDEVDGGFHYKPKVGFSFGPISTLLSYTGIVLEDQSYNSINLGFEVAF
jgi:hypothetical protein